MSSGSYDYNTTLLQKTLINYAALGNNIVGLPSSVSVSDGNNHVTSYTTYSYDESGVQSTSAPNHSSVTGSRGNATTVNSYTVNSSFLTKHFSYYDTGEVNQFTDVNSALTTYNYDANGNCVAHTVPTKVTLPVSGLSSSTTWDCNGGVAISTIDPNGHSTATGYVSDPYYWRPDSSTDLGGNTTFYGYGPNSSYPTLFYASSGLYFNGSNSVVGRVQYKDALGRTYVDQTAQSPTSSTLDSVSYTYDANGRLYSASMPCSVGYTGTCSTPPTTQTYDALNRPRVTTDGGSGTVTLAYTQNDVLQTIGPAPFKNKQLEYDALGRLTSVCEITSATGSGTCGQAVPQTGYWTKYTYDFSGGYNRVTVTQNAQSSTTQTRTYLYDLLGRLVQETNPENGLTKYVYDTNSSGSGYCATAGFPSAAGDLVARYDANGNSACYQYDALHRVASITYYGPNTTPSKHFIYDYVSTQTTNSKGRLSEAMTCTAGASTCVGNVLTDELFSYSARGEITDVYESTPNTAGSYYHGTGAYWANGALNTLSLFNSSGSALIPMQTYGVDGEGRTYSVSAASGQNPVASTVYDLPNYKVTVNYGSLDSDVFTSDPNTGRTSQYKFNVSSYSDTGTLTWNQNGSLGQLAIVDGVPGISDTQTCNYTDDDLARIASVSCNTWSQTFSFDAFSNITKSGSMNWGCATCYDASSNHYNHTLSGVISYDADGNLLNDTFHTYAWDAEGHPTTIDSVQFTYDALGRMVEGHGSTYVQIVYGVTGSKLAVMTGQTLARAYVPLPGGATAYYTPSGLAYYRHSDWLGSSRLATTPSRTLYSEAAYAPYGESYATSGTSDLNFTGQNQDLTTGLYEFMFRRYHPTQGRWLSPDPAGAAAVDFTNPQSLNRYAYVGNSPLGATDPLGLLDNPLCPPSIGTCGGGGGFGYGGYAPGSGINMGGGTSLAIDRCGVDPFCIAQGGIGLLQSPVAYGQSWANSIITGAGVYINSTNYVYWLGIDGNWYGDFIKYINLIQFDQAANARVQMQPYSQMDAFRDGGAYIKTHPVFISVNEIFAGQITYQASSKTICGNLGLGASVPPTKAVTVGMLNEGNMGKWTDVQSSWGYSFGANLFLGYQGSFNSSGKIGGPTVSGVGLSGSYSYGGCTTVP